MSSHSIPLPYKDQPTQAPLINLYDFAKNITNNPFQSLLSDSKRDKLKELIEDVLLDQQKAEVNEKSEKYQFENSKQNLSSLFLNNYFNNSDTDNSSNLSNQNKNSVEYCEKNEIITNPIVLTKNQISKQKEPAKISSNISILQKEMIDLIEKGPSMAMNKETSLEELNEKDRFLTKNIDKNISYLQNIIKLTKNNGSHRIKYSKEQLNNLIKQNSDMNKETPTLISNLSSPKKLVRKQPINSNSIHQISNEEPTSTIFKLDHLNEPNYVYEQPKKKLNLSSSINYKRLKSLEKDSMERQTNTNEKINYQIENLNAETEKTETNKKRQSKLKKNSSKLINTDKILIKKTLEESDNMLGQNKSKYTCVECGMHVKKLSLLKKHLLSHTNLKPFNCVICRRKFTTKGNLVKHLKTKAHVNRCVCMGMDENDRKIMEITNDNIDQTALNVQTEIKNKIRITRQ